MVYLHSILSRSVYEKNMATINKHNAKYASGEVTWYMKETVHMDLTGEEFVKLRTGKSIIQ